MWESAGKTRSGKIIYFTMNPDNIDDLFATSYKSFRDHDYFDSYAVYQYLISRRINRGEDYQTENIHSERAQLEIGITRLWKIADQLKLPTISHIVAFGKKLVNREFQDP